MSSRRYRKLHKNPQEGSALLVTLMVMAGLSLLGLGYVAISETESAIAVHERNAVQTREVAEAGVKLVIEWFQDPEWADAVDLLPPNIAAIKLDRVVNTVNIGKYKTTSGALLFDQPHKPADPNRFFGSYEKPDVWITNSRLNAATDAADKQFLNSLNQEILNGDYAAGRITDIRVYAPPMSGATLNADKFWEGGTRLGLATIAVTATKCRNDSDANPCSDTSPDSDIIAQRTVRAVISEWPFPGPSGPVQTNANLGTNGNVQVHWGKITATGEMALKRPFGPLPWHDAHLPVNFQYGYALSPTVASTNNPWLADSASTDFRNKVNWLYAIVDKELEDPWYEARTRGDHVGTASDGTGADNGPVEYAYDDPEQALWDTQGGGQFFRAAFQNQTHNEMPNYQSVLFPKFDYDFWKDVAQTADDQDTVFYLTYEDGENFSDKEGTVKAFQDWINTQDEGIAGYYFFDTVEADNPQNGGPGDLTPPVSIKGNPFLAQGFVYLNSEQWDSAGGAKGVTGYYNMPGEPYKDIGFWTVDEATGDWTDNGSGVPIKDFNDNKQWDYQDLKFSMGGTEDNDRFDYVLESRTFKRPTLTGTTGGDITMHFIKPYYPGCNPGVNCSEPHEPYLNYEFTVAAVGSIDIAAADVIKPKWTNVNSGWGQALAKKTDTETPDGTPYDCSTLPADVIVARERCTSNAYDKDGPLVALTIAFNGVLYVEGEFEQTGNISFFGSILSQGDFGKAGSPDVWFDERLIKNEWPPREFRFPRVFISAIQSD